MTKTCEKCGAQNSAGMRLCGSCGGPLGEDIPETNSPGYLPLPSGDQRPIEGLWAVPSSESLAVYARRRGTRQIRFASVFLIAALALFALSFALEVYSSEKAEELTDAAYSGNYDELIGAMEDMQDITRVAKWSEYLYSIGLIVLAAGLVGMALGLSKYLPQ